MSSPKKVNKISYLSASQLLLCKCFFIMELNGFLAWELGKEGHFRYTELFCEHRSLVTGSIPDSDVDMWPCFLYCAALCRNGGLVLG